MDCFLVVRLLRHFEFELGFLFSGEIVEKVKVTAILYQQLPSHITHRQVIRQRGSVPSACLWLRAHP